MLIIDLLTVMLKIGYIIVIIKYKVDLLLNDVNYSIIFIIE